MQIIEKRCHPERAVGEVKDLTVASSRYAERFFIPLRSIQNDDEKATKRAVILNER